VREQRKDQRGPKVYSLHAPEVECIGMGKAHRPYEFGVRLSIATTLHHSQARISTSRTTFSSSTPRSVRPTAGTNGFETPVLTSSRNFDNRRRFPRAQMLSPYSPIDHRV
jgi:hypothetical protein